jgi:hypothetical protein
MNLNNKPHVALQQQMGDGGNDARLGFILLGLATAGPVQAQRESLGIFSHWGASRKRTSPMLRDHGTEPPPRASEQRAFASVGYWPHEGRPRAGAFPLSAVKRPARPCS